MIVGAVTADRDPIVSLVVLAANGSIHDVGAVVDTGFNGWLTLPPDVIAALRLAWKRFGRAVLADGRETFFDVYEGELIWDGQRRTIPIDESNSAPLVGMRLMDGYELRVQAVIAGSVVLQRIEG